MKITEIKVTVCCPGRNFLTVKIVTDSGLYGLGDATVNGRELAVKAYLEEHVVPCLIGRDASHIEDIWHYLYRGAYWRRGPVTMAAIAGIDTALWDIKAKAAGMPLYQLLGGPSRKKILAYRHASGRDSEEAIDAVAALRGDGYRAIRVQCGLPGLPPIYGTDGKSTNAGVSLPVEELWSTPLYLNHVPRLFEKVRLTFGEELHLLHDVHHRLTPIEAARLGKALEPYNLFFLEDTIPAEVQEHFRLIRQHTTTPLAVGEVFNSIWDSRLLLEENLIDYIRSTCVHAGGPTHLRRIADLAGLHQVRTAFHGAMDMSPICFAANLHLDLWAPNFGIQEYTPYTEEALEVFKGHWSYDGDGYLHPGDAPGHGVGFDEELAGKYPYERSYLAVNRLMDGTLWHW